MTRQRALWTFVAFALGFIVSLGRLDAAALLLIGLVVGVGCLVTPLAPLAVMLAAAPLRALIATEAPDLLPVDIGQLFFAAFLISWAYQRLVVRGTLRGVIRPTPVVYAVFAFLFASGLSAFSALSLHAWLIEWLKWVQIALLTVAVVDVASHDGVDCIVFALVTAALANAIVGLYEFFGGSGALHLLVEDRFFRAFGTFGQPNPFGGFMGLTAPLAFALTAVTIGRLWRRRHVAHGRAGRVAAAIFSIISAGVISFAIYASYSRGAWLAFGAASAVMIVAIPVKGRYSAALLAAGIVVALLVSLTGLLPASIQNRLSTITSEFSTIGDVRGVDITPENYANIERLAHWQAAVNMANARPWLGVGFGNYEIAYADYSLLNWNLSLGHAHNYYLNVVAETGMIGLLTYAALALVVLFCVWRLRGHPDFAVRWLSIGALGSWIYLGVHSLTDNLFVNNLFLHIGVIIALVALMDGRLNRVTND